MNLKNIKNIVFDLGGVILNIDYELTIKAFETLGIPNFKEEYSKLSQSQLFDQIETGRIDPFEFRNKIREVAGKDLSDNTIDTAWNALILNIPKHRIKLLKLLKNKYRLFLLSNTNIIHYKHYTERIKRENKVDGLESFFEKTYLSHEIGMRKPDGEIFKFVLEENNLKPSETLFIDDSPQHIEGAIKQGIVAYHVKKNEDIIDLF